MIAAVVIIAVLAITSALLGKHLWRDQFEDAAMLCYLFCVCAAAADLYLVWSHYIVEWRPL